MELETVLSNDSIDFCSVQDKQYGAKDRSLWDPILDRLNSCKAALV